MADFIENSRLWDRDPDAQRVFKQLPAAARQRLQKRADRVYGRRGRRRWETLLSVVAKDQKLFATMLPSGPTQVIQTTDSGYPSAKKVWTAYARQSLHVLGLGAASAPAPARQRSRLNLGKLAAAQRAHILHWFHHAFRNLVRYRDGHPSLPFDPRCAKACGRVLNRF